MKQKISKIDTQEAGWIGLANAIVVRAAKDYVFCRVNPKAKRYPNSMEVIDRDEVKRFFKSPWYQALTSADSGYIVSELEKYVLEEQVKKAEKEIRKIAEKNKTA